MGSLGLFIITSTYMISKKGMEVYNEFSNPYKDA